MATQPTNLSVPSESPRDLKFNAGKIDEFVTSMGWAYTDRFGVQHYTIEGMRWLAQQAIAEFGYITMDSFEDGNTLTLPNQVLRLEANGEYYRWDGVFPKNVPAASTPDSTGGIGVGAWVGVGDASLRSDLDNQGVINFSHDNTYDISSVGAHLQNVVYPTDAPFNAPTDGTTDATSALQSSAAHCISVGKKLVLNKIFMVSDTFNISDGLVVECLTNECGIYSTAGAGKFAVK